MVTSVTSSRVSDFTPAGSLMSDRCSEWLISRLLTSASIYCGMLSTEHSRSMVGVTMLTVPPRFTPGAASAFWMRRGMLTRMVAPSPSRMKCGDFSVVLGAMTLPLVMAWLNPAIHPLRQASYQDSYEDGWMPGSSPGMTGNAPELWLVTPFSELWLSAGRSFYPRSASRHI